MKAFALKKAISKFKVPITSPQKSRAGRIDELIAG